MTKHLLALVLLIGVLPTYAHAQWNYALGVGARYLQVTEDDQDGNELVHERGWLPGLEAAASYASGDWRAAFSVASYRSDIAYRGQLQRGATFATKTSTVQQRATATVSYAVNQRWRLHGGLELDRWQRRIDGRGVAIGLDEQYTSTRFLAGASTRLWHGALAGIDLDPAAVFARPERLRVRFDRDLFDEVQLRTRSATGLRAAVTIVPASLPDLAFVVEADWLKIARSADMTLYRNSVAVGSVAQPEHERLALTMHANWRF